MSSGLSPFQILASEKYSSCDVWTSHSNSLFHCVLCYVNRAENVLVMVLCVNMFMNWQFVHYSQFWRTKTKYDKVFSVMEDQGCRNRCAMQRMKIRNQHSFSGFVTKDGQWYWLMDEWAQEKPEQGKVVVRTDWQVAPLPLESVYNILWHVNALPGNGSINTLWYMHSTMERGYAMAR
jgi:hypothetical protein